jgi:hypothetical protein
MSFEKLIKSDRRKEADTKAASGFHMRQTNRDKIYSEKAKNQAPTKGFFSRSYNL